MGWREKGPPPVRKISKRSFDGSEYYKVVWHGGDHRYKARRETRLMNEFRQWSEEFARRSRRWSLKTLAWTYRRLEKPRSWKNHRDHQWKPVVA